MTISGNIDPDVYKFITAENIQQVNAYIEAPMSATWFKESQSKNHEVVTSEVIYFWMIQLSIPFECQKWHLNRLLALIRVCSEKGQTQKHMPVNDIYAQNRALNEARRKAMNSRG